VPTVIDRYPDLTLDGLIGIFGPRDMPQPLRERIAADVKTADDDSSIHSRLTAARSWSGLGRRICRLDRQAARGPVEVARVLGIKSAT
jgi:hypothetical protein